jgi:hypothetical protein
MLSRAFYITIFIYLCSLYYIFKYKPQIFFNYIKTNENCIKTNENNTSEFKLHLETALILLIIIIYIVSLLINKVK